MKLNIAKELAELRQMTATQLRARYAKLSGETSNTSNKEWLIRRNIWLMQAKSMGGLSERARARAAELADEADLRRNAPCRPKPLAESPDMVVKADFRPRKNKMALPPGMRIVRDYKDKTLVVHVLASGFEYEGEVYKSLSGLAKKITGIHYNGYLFFGLTKKGERA